MVPGLAHPTTPQIPDPLSAVLEQRLSVERLRPYLVEVGGDLDQAPRLYEWNAAVSGAFFEILGHFEVLLRNSLHEQVVRRPGLGPRRTSPG